MDLYLEVMAMEMEMEMELEVLRVVVLGISKGMWRLFFG